MEPEDPYKIQTPLLNFTHEKAGMKGLDRGKIDKIIHDASVGSDFYKHGLEQAKQIEEKVASMRNEIALTLSKGPSYIRKITEEIALKIQEIESERILTETWIHIDMDMFYASVEIRDAPELADKPIAVGGNSMISTANYIARQFGVRSAMPGFIAKKLCKDLVFVTPNFQKYQVEGEKIREIFREYDSEFESMGLDEGNLRVTEVLIDSDMNNNEGRMRLAKEIRDKIFEKTGLNASAGIACNKVLAKIATDMGKPNGQYLVPFSKSEILEFISNLNIRKIPGIGKVLEKVLNELGITTCADLLTKKLEIFLAFSAGSFDFLIKAGLGIGSVYHPSAKDDQKSISCSSSFKATDNFEEIIGKIQEFAHDVSIQLDEKNAQAKNISVTIKNYRFESKVKSKTLAKYVFKAGEIAEIAVKLFRDMHIQEKVRLVGVRAADFCNRAPGSLDCLLEKANSDSAGTPTVKVFQQSCPICSKSFAYTEKRMEVHINQCLDSSSQNPKPEKRAKPQAKPKVTLDLFYKKK